MPTLLQSFAHKTFGLQKITDSEEQALECVNVNVIISPEEMDHDKAIGNGIGMRKNTDGTIQTRTVCVTDHENVGNPLYLPFKTQRMWRRMCIRCLGVVHLEAMVEGRDKDGDERMLWKGSTLE